MISARAMIREMRLSGITRGAYGNVGCVTVGIGLRHRLGADACAGTFLVLDNYRLSPRGTEPLSHCACDGVGRSAGWVRNTLAAAGRPMVTRPQIEKLSARIEALADAIFTINDDPDDVVEGIRRNR